MSKLIIEFQSVNYNPLQGDGLGQILKYYYPSQPFYLLYYKQEDEKEYKQILVSTPQLKLFLEEYGYQTNDIHTLVHLGLSSPNMKLNKNLKITD